MEGCEKAPESPAFSHVSHAGSKAGLLTNPDFLNQNKELVSLLDSV